MIDYHFCSTCVRTAFPMPALSLVQGTRSDVALQVLMAGSLERLFPTWWRHHWCSESGAILLSLAELRDGWLFRVPDVADFAVRENGNSIKVRPLRTIGAATLEHLLIDQVLPRVLAQQGNWLLHAAAVEIDGRVVLLLGDSGRGKSTLSAVLQRHGHRVFSDDCVMLTQQGAAVKALPTYPSLRLLEDTLDYLGQPGSASDGMVGYGAKRRLPAQSIWDTPGGVAVAAICVLDVPVVAVSPLRIETLSPSRTCIELTRNTFRLDPLDKRGTIDLFARSVDAAASVPAFALHYPRHFAAVSSVASDLADMVRGLPAGQPQPSPCAR